MNVYIIYRSFLNSDKTTLSIGGIQTYILNLCDVICELNMQPIVCQISDENFESQYNKIKVFGFKSDVYNISRVAIKELNLTNQPIIFGTNELITAYGGPSIAIQHGITWDIPSHLNFNKLLNYCFIFRSAYNAYKNLRQLSKVKHVVCVDYNFVNWYRTQVAYPDIKTTVIPNFAVPQEKCVKSKDCINIIFARRLFWYRGTRLFLEVVDNLLNKYNNVRFTIAGSGPDESLFKEKFNNNDRVKIINYKSEESYLIHSDKDIAVVPTLGSEGTSLSLLEAMASQCAVVCTNVGGMTNIVIDGYNGIMVNPEFKELEGALIRLIEDNTFRSNIAGNAYKTVESGFSLKIWKKRWSKIIASEFN